MLYSVKNFCTTINIINFDIVFLDEKEFTITIFFDILFGLFAIEN